MSGSERHRPETLREGARWIAATLALLVGIFALAGWLSARAEPAPDTAAVVVAEVAPPPAAAPEAEPEPVYTLAAQVAPLSPSALDVVEGELRRGQTLSAALRARDVPASMVHEIATAMQPVFDFRYSRPGDGYWLGRDADQELVLFRYERSAIERYVLRRDGEELVASRFEPEIEVRQAHLAGMVTSSLYESIRALGEEGELAHDFAQIFAWDVDFSRNVQPGDEFHILYERRFLTEGGAEDYLGPGRILAARYSNAEDDYTAIHFQTSEDRSGYYRVDGSSVERQFLRAPLNYRRISSNYSASRLHPIMKVRRPHPAIDYAAPTGTPVWSVGNGTVIFRGVLGGLGKTVKVRHPNGYVTFYAHLSRFERGINVGDRIRQKEVLGYVGSTGTATGPHLDYRMKHHGRYVNPAHVQTPPGEPITPELMPAFLEARDEYLDVLDPRQMRVVTREAAG